MSLVYAIVILIMEYVLWFYMNHSAERPIDRTKNLILVSFCFAVLAIAYASSWTLMGRTQFIDLTPGVYWFIAVNLAVAVVFSMALLATRRMRVRHS